MNLLNAVGLLYDIVGVLLVGFSIAKTPSARIFLQASTFWDANNEALKSLLEQRADMRLGLPLLVFGFFLQLLAGLGVEADRVGAVIFAVLLLAYFVVIFPVRNWMVALQFERLTGRRIDEWARLSAEQMRSKGTS